MHRSPHRRDCLVCTHSASPSAPPTTSRRAAARVRPVLFRARERVDPVAETPADRERPIVETSIPRRPSANWKKKDKKRDADAPPRMSPTPRRPRSKRYVSHDDPNARATRDLTPARARVTRALARMPCAAAPVTPRCSRLPMGVGVFPKSVSRGVPRRTMSLTVLDRARATQRLCSLCRP